MRHFSASLPMGLFLAAFCAWMVLAPAAAGAGTLSIQTSVSALYQDGRARVYVTINNQGDESAFKLSLKAALEGESVEQPGPEELPPNKPARLTLELPFKPPVPGTYAVIIWVRFHDGNGYPFNSLGNALLSAGKAPAASLLLRGQPAKLDGESEVVFQLANLDERAKDVELTFYGPQELTLPKGAKQISLAGRSKEQVAIAVSNFTALPGAAYPVLCRASYLEGGSLFTVLGTAQITVARDSDPLKSLTPYLVPAAVVMAIAVGLLLWLGRRGGKSRPKGKPGA